MVKKAFKKGVSHVDWAISLSLFLVFVAWFFAFLLPSVQKTSQLSPLLRVVESGIKNDGYWTINKLPIIIESNFTKSNTGIYHEFPYDNYSFVDHRWFGLDSGMVYYIADLSRGLNLLYMVDSEGINRTYSPRQQVSDENQTNLLDSNLTMVFVNGSLARAIMSDYTPVSNISYLAEGEDIGFVESNITDLGIAVIRRAWFDNFFMKTIVYEKNAKISMLLSDKTRGTHNVTMNLQLHPFGTYWSDAEHTSVLNYSGAGCTNYTAGQVAFYDNNRTMLIASTKNMGIIVCYSNASLSSNLTVSTNDTRMEMAWHNNEHNRTAEYFENPIIKMSLQKEVHGLSIARLNQLLAIGYEGVKTDWGLSEDTGFKLKIYNESSLTDYFVLGPDPDTEVDVYVKEWYDWIVDGQGNKTKVVVNLRVWE